LAINPVVVESETVPEEVVEEVKAEEVIDKSVFEHNKTILKSYRKYQVLIRDAFGIEATEDEEETVEKVFSHVMGIIKLIQTSLPQKNFEGEATEQEANLPEVEQTTEELAKSILKGFVI